MNTHCIRVAIPKSWRQPALQLRLPFLTFRPNILNVQEMRKQPFDFSQRMAIVSLTGKLDPQPDLCVKLMYINS